jgi:hypothetical protein
MMQFTNLENGDLEDDARVELGIVGPWWSPIMRFRVYMNHKPEEHLTIWKVHRLSHYVGSWTPPGWLLKLIGEVKK